MTDSIIRFIFEQADIRGEHVQLQESYREVLNAHHYPPAVRALLGEFMAAASLLSATIKIDGSLTLQARSDGEVPLIMAEATSGGQLRAIAKTNDEVMGSGFHELLRNGQLCITIDPEQGKRYQGIVNLDGDNLASCIESYFRQSEQLSTRLWLATSDYSAAGLLLQELPGERDIEYWQHVCQLADTVKAEELLELDCEALLYRLYHQEDVRLFPAEPLEFHCSCSRERLGRALLTLGREELESCIADLGQLDINCEFCNRRYLFEEADVRKLLDPDTAGTRH